MSASALAFREETKIKRAYKFRVVQRRRAKLVTLGNVFSSRNRRYRKKWSWGSISTNFARSTIWLLAVCMLRFCVNVPLLLAMWPRACVNASVNMYAFIYRSKCVCIRVCMCIGYIYIDIFWSRIEKHAYCIFVSVYVCVCVFVRNSTCNF